MMANVVDHRGLPQIMMRLRAWSSFTRRAVRAHRCPAAPGCARACIAVTSRVTIGTYTACQIGREALREHFVIVERFERIAIGKLFGVAHRVHGR